MASLNLIDRILITLMERNGEGATLAEMHACLGGIKKSVGQALRRGRDDAGIVKDESIGAPVRRQGGRQRDGRDRGARVAPRRGR